VFRILPYLQNPSADGIRITWFTDSEVPCTLEVWGGAIPASAPRSLTVKPERQEQLGYTEIERNQTIPGLEQGSWLAAGPSYKATLELADLDPDTTYSYRVRAGESVEQASFQTPPSAAGWNQLRLIALSDSETDPLGRGNRRDWPAAALGSGQRPDPSSSAWARRFGTSTTTVLAPNGLPQSETALRYALTETEGFDRNLELIAQRQPDLLLMPGDLVQGGAYQPGWDEFFRHTAGELGNLLSSTPILPALGNWETFGAVNGSGNGYGSGAVAGSSEPGFLPLQGRLKYHTYFDAPANGTPSQQDDYYSVDVGPVTILTLDSTNGSPDETTSSYGGPGQPARTLGLDPYSTDPALIGTDTQPSYTASQYADAAAKAGVPNDLAPFGPGSTQWNWTQAQLQQARDAGRIVIVQFHHAPYSSGSNSRPLRDLFAPGLYTQSGTPLRIYQPLFEQYGVALVLNGHDEMFEESYVDLDRDGRGVTYYDVGVAGDGLRGGVPDVLNLNPFSVWSADRNEAEVWQTLNGVPQLISGGRHYGHLEINLTRLPSGSGAYEAAVSLQPVHLFPVLDANYNLVRTERRPASHSTTLLIDGAGRAIKADRPLPEAAGFGDPSAPLDLQPGRTCTLPGLRDYDGIPHGGAPEALNNSIAADYRFQGLFSLQRDGLPQALFTNRSSGRWASAAVDPLTRQIDYADHGKGGITRVVGIYDDPLVKEGEQNTARPGYLLSGEKAPKRGGPNDSQRRFQNDLLIDNLSARLSGDFDNDGIQELYWKVNDGTAYLRSLLHDDGNIRYANYQSRDQTTSYLTSNGHADLIPSVL
jgi:hypothetical protein